MNQTNEPTTESRAERHLVIALAILVLCGLVASASSCGQEDLDFGGITNITNLRATATFVASQPTETPDPNL